MTWIQTIPYASAAGRLKKLYDHVKGPGDNVDNIMMAHSLRPHTMEGHLSLYKHVLHHSGNSLPRWYMECLGLYVSLMNSCDYCVEHHYEGLRRLLGNGEPAKAIRDALEQGNLPEGFDGKEQAGIRYAQLLTQAPNSVAEDDIQGLRRAGFNDGEILEANQVISYFAYANRLVLGLGVTTEGDILGLSPSSDDPDNWSHR